LIKKDKNPCFKVILNYEFVRSVSGLSSSIKLRSTWINKQGRKNGSKRKNYEQLQTKEYFIHANQSF